ncbi:peptidoglycan-binding protein [Aetokthonos hydrillicola Thurmond2011]|uniref:Peptidoglycan-binding protein n=1 Tax=Aetokthonos hydrillicola Thurmond2011 TaxID=2712845 RepID=A0AAP5I7F2_9CYAN|nr:peptidoglycan-binding domain-containing protein [Aetokthonos hydrillicola]MBO3458227.1 peptidoglycan-binding protein [Aetokthonos hydrillicola CCALA 1050]MBW4584446.1 peptidoglycan-binding protein [Aetokthonos hydrillicola CCALA 1050]MDR9896408.1 peptidoglycan-binding protein [Aetokthonos hydrillicola Thurmond2011]
MTQPSPILQRGATGAFVERLQRDLSQLGYEIGPNGVNGEFDEYTENAIKKFQQDHNLTVDGVVGPQTGKQLGAALA